MVGLRSFEKKDLGLEQELDLMFLMELEMFPERRTWVLDAHGKVWTGWYQLVLQPWPITLCPEIGTELGWGWSTRSS